MQHNQGALNQLLGQAGTIGALSSLMGSTQHPSVWQGAASLLAVLCATENSSKQQVGIGPLREDSCYAVSSTLSRLHVLPIP
jgi:hypothetical protein